MPLLWFVVINLVNRGEKETHTFGNREKERKRGRLISYQ